MPIKIPNSLPAAGILQNENIFVMTEQRATTQDIRPLRIALLNLMPTKIITETQLCRLLSNTPLQVEIELIQMRSHISKNTSAEHMLTFYKTFDQIQDQKFDGMIITGAPIELLDFDEVEYWQELCEIMDWTLTNVYSTLHICWGAQAALYHHYGIPKHDLESKMFGVFAHRVEDKCCTLLRGFDDVFMAPHSRRTMTTRADVEKAPEVTVLASSDKAGIYALSAQGDRQIFITGHAEYDADTLLLEYRRDKQAGVPITIPENYFPNNDDTAEPIVSWRGHGSLLYANWLNYCVYQATPYDLSAM